MVMEALRPNLDLKPTHCTCTPILTEFPRPTSLLFPSHNPRFSSLINRQRSKKWSWRVPTCAWYQSDSDSKSQPQQQQLMTSIGKGLFGFAAAATALVSVCCDSPALAESLTVAFPVSRAQEVSFSYYVFVWFELPNCLIRCFFVLLC